MIGGRSEREKERTEASTLHDYHHHHHHHHQQQQQQQQHPKSASKNQRPKGSFPHPPLEGGNKER